MKKIILLIMILILCIGSYCVWHTKQRQQKIEQQAAQLSLHQQRLRNLTFQNTQAKLHKNDILALLLNLNEVKELGWSQIEAELSHRIGKFCFTQQPYSAQIFNMRRDHDKMQQDLAHFEALFKAPHRETSPLDRVLLTLIQDNIADAYTYPIQQDEEQHVLTNYAFVDQKNNDCKTHLSQAVLKNKR